MNNKPIIDDRYTQLARVLMDAMEQAVGGKGMERHADGERFEDQKICVINRWLRGSPIAGALFQAVKKTVETSRMTPSAAIREIYGAINYLSAGIILLEEIERESGSEIVSLPEVPMIEMNCLCMPDTSEVNSELRELDSTKEMQVSVYTDTTCFECFYGNLPPDEMPCKKCIDKPMRPHFTSTVAPKLPGPGKE